MSRSFWRSLRTRIILIAIVTCAFLTVATGSLFNFLRSSHTATIRGEQQRLVRVAANLAQAYGIQVSTGTSLRHVSPPPKPPEPPLLPTRLAGQEPPPPPPPADPLSQITAAVLQREDGIEGGYLAGAGPLMGYAFPTHEGPGAQKEMPQRERPTIDLLAHQAEATGTAQTFVFEGPHDVVLFYAQPIREMASGQKLFGHERGSFTSAIAQKTGKFEVANGGTVFLDEIGELPLALQPKLLRILQEHTFERVGATSQIRTDVRIIAATNRQLDHDVENKLFRADLYHRLNTYALRLPPLRERVSDILPLAEHFLEQYARRNGMPKQGLSPEAGEVLERHAFPGNVRELEHLMERTAVQAGGRAITAEMIEEQLSTNHVSSTGISLQTLLSLPFHDAVASLEKLLLQEVLRSVGENKSEAARRLGIHRRFLYEKLQQHKLA